MNILEINKFYYARRGAERHMLDVIDLFESEGHNVAVFSMQHPNNIASKWSRFFVSHVGYNRNDSDVWEKIVGVGRLFWSFEARAKIKKLLKEFRPDVVHLHNMYHQLSPSILMPLKRSGAKIIMTVHDYNLVSPDKDEYYEHVGRQYWKFLFVRKYGFMKRLLLVLKMYVEKYFDLYEKTVDMFIAPSRFVEDVLIRGGMDARKIVVVSHFISRKQFDIALTDDAVGKKYALYFGSLSEGKGIAELVRIFDMLRIPLVLAGTCESGFVLPESEWVNHVGQKNKEELERLIRDATCVVSGSRLPETFGLVALEALSFGKPFFGLKSGAYTEMIENGKNGFLARDFDDLRVSLDEFFNDASRFDALAIQRDTYAKYASATYYEKWLETLKIV